MTNANLNSKNLLGFRFTCDYFKHVNELSFFNNLVEQMEM